MSYERLIDDVKRSAEDVDKVILEIIEGSDSDILRNSSKHLLNSGGKRIRPYVLLESVKAVNGEVDKSARYIAAAVELLHNYSLVHDDIMDEDEMRRNRQTIHMKWGEDIGILAGDFLFAKVFESISNANILPKKLNHIYRIISKTSSRLCEGQVQDVNFEGRSDVSTAECEEMIFGKTGALFRGAAKSGAVIGSENKKYHGALADYGTKMGIGFQIWDDVLDLKGNEEDTGKPVGSDIIEGKRTLIVSHFLDNAPEEDRSEFLEILGSEKDDKVDKAIMLLESNGSVEFASNRAGELIEESKEALKVLEDSKAKNNLLKLSDFVIDRCY